MVEIVLKKNIKILFGKFDELITSAVFTETWWFALASGVALEGETTTVQICPSRRHSISWVNNRIGVLGVGEDLKKNQYSMVTAGGDSQNLYPFFLKEREGVAVLEFSCLGPDKEVRNSIASALLGQLETDDQMKAIKDKLGL